MHLKDERLIQKVRRIALLNSVAPSEALESVVSHGLAYMEQIEENSLYKRRLPENLKGGART